MYIEEVHVHVHCVTYSELSVFDAIRLFSDPENLYLNTKVIINVDVYKKAQLGARVTRQSAAI